MRKTVHFLIYQLASTLGVIVLSGFLTYFFFSVLQIVNPTFNSRRASWVLTELPGFPVQLATSLIVGFLWGRYGQHRLMSWVWILPLIYFCFGLFFEEHSRSSFFGNFIGCGPTNGCFEQFLYTLPFFTSIAFALGALMAAKWKQIQSEN